MFFSVIQYHDLIEGIPLQETNLRWRIRNLVTPGIDIRNKLKQYIDCFVHLRNQGAISVNCVILVTLDHSDLPVANQTV